MKIVFFLLLLSGPLVAFSQRDVFDSDYDSFPQDSIIFHYCSDCPGNEGYSFPLDMTDSVFYSIFNEPDKVVYFGRSQAYHMTYADNRTDTVAFYFCDLPKDSGFHKARFTFLKYPGRAKLEGHNLLPKSSISFGNHVLTNETTIEEIAELFPQSYETALKEEDRVSAFAPNEKVFGITLHTFPWNPFYDRNGSTPAPYIRLIFVNGKLAIMTFQTRT